MNREVHIILCS